VTLNNEKDLASWNKKQRDDVPPETLLEEYTTPKSDDEDSTSTNGGVVLDDEAATTLSSPPEDDETVATKEERKDLPSLAFSPSSTSPPTSEANGTSGDSTNDNKNSSSAEASVVPPSIASATESATGDTKTDKKAPVETFNPPADVYEFNEPFLWFLHAINEEPMFMGVIESYKRYLEETGHKDNNVGNKVSGVIEKNGWIYEAARGILWHCPSMINKQAE
jgi:hypothetical protein